MNSSMSFSFNPLTLPVSISLMRFSMILSVFILSHFIFVLVLLFVGFAKVFKSKGYAQILNMENAYIVKEGINLSGKNALFIFLV